ncbi:MAG TPA: response regulator transcription factor [Pyrinomonadaceae bacterium]|jgi:DNA-binding NarL/FixJ family response regulator|nr:response regulator transcription factor [Pyrinomonadaceae bacterium]
MGSTRLPTTNRLAKLIEETGKDRSRPEVVNGPTAIKRKPLRILIADDQMLVRAGLCELVKLLPDVKVVAQASDGREVLRLIETHDPDIVLMDVAMPEMNGLEATVLAKKQFPNVKVIILSEQSGEEFVFRSLRAGADGLVLKDDSVEELHQAIKSVAQGNEHLSPKVTRKVVLGYLNRQPSGEKLVKLSPRQREILQLIAEGKATKEIAKLLKISINTVKTHRLKLMEKLGAHEITGLVRYAAKLGLLKSPIFYVLLLPSLLTQISYVTTLQLTS